MTNGIEFYEKVAYIEEHFEEEKGKLVENLKNRQDNCSGG